MCIHPPPPHLFIMHPCSFRFPLPLEVRFVILHPESEAQREKSHPRCNSAPGADVIIMEVAPPPAAVLGPLDSFQPRSVPPL
jgi:hypothetical protein